MQPLGHGVDIIELVGFRRLIEDPGGHFLSRCYTQQELSDVGEGPNRVDRLAGRFAAKESVVKALGVGWGDGIAWTDIEIHTLASGAPHIVLSGGASEVASQLGISHWLVSTSHMGSYAIASAIALG